MMFSIRLQVLMVSRFHHSYKLTTLTVILRKELTGRNVTDQAFSHLYKFKGLGKLGLV